MNSLARQVATDSVRLESSLVPSAAVHLRRSNAAAGMLRVLLAACAAERRFARRGFRSPLLARLSA